MKSTLNSWFFYKRNDISNLRNKVFRFWATKFWWYIDNKNLRICEIQLGFQWFYFLKVQLKGSIPAFSNTAIFSIE
jgi:hypothetical protein